MQIAVPLAYLRLTLFRVEVSLLELTTVWHFATPRRRTYTRPDATVELVEA